MLRNEIQKKTGLTRKAIEYYEDKGLIRPDRDSNGYRIYSEEDLERLEKISILRKIGVSVEDIKDYLSKDKANLSYILRKKQIILDIEESKKEALEILIKGYDKEKLSEKLAIIENKETIYEKLERAFPGYFGQLIFASYKPFLNEPLDAQGKKAFSKYVKYLDDLPEFKLSEDEENYIDKLSLNFDMDDLKNINKEKINAIYNAKEWLRENDDIIKSYEDFENSKFYRESPLYKINEKLKKYMADNNYYEIAIPLIRKFSKSYDKYYRKLLEANTIYLNKNN